MTIPITTPGSPPRRSLRSAGAVLAGFAAVVVLSLVTDQVLHLLQVYPPWGQPMFEPGLNLLALSYRIVYTIVGGYITARLAPRNPMRHALILGVIGTIVGTAGAIATIPLNMGPSWYPIALAITGLPCTWLALHLAWRSSIPQKARRIMKNAGTLKIAKPSPREGVATVST